MWSYTRKLPLSGRVNSCSAPKCFLNVQLVFPTLNLCTCQSLQLIYISHIIYIYINIYVHDISLFATSQSDLYIQYLFLGKVAALLHYWETKATNVCCDKGSCFWNEHVEDMSCIHIYIYTYTCHWYQMISQHVRPAVKFRPFVPDKFACQVLKLE